MSNKNFVSRLVNIRFVLRLRTDEGSRGFLFSSIGNDYENSSVSINLKLSYLYVIFYYLDDFLGK